MFLINSNYVRRKIICQYTGQFILSVTIRINTSILQSTNLDNLMNENAGTIEAANSKGFIPNCLAKPGLENMDVSFNAPKISSSDIVMVKSYKVETDQ